MIATVLILAAFAGLAVVLGMRRIGEIKERDLAWGALAAKTPWEAIPFTPDAIAGLPASARRYFEASIQPETPLLPVVSLVLRGAFEHAPLGRRRMRGFEMLSPPHGSALRLYPDPNPLAISGAVILEGGGARTRFWALGLIPLAARTAENDRDVLLARMLVESCLWSPAALLRSPAISIRPYAGNVFTVSMVSHERVQEATVEIAADGKVASVAAPIGANGGVLKAEVRGFGAFEGYSLPVSVVFRYEPPGSVPGYSEVRVERVRFIGPWAGSRRS